MLPVKIYSFEKKEGKLVKSNNSFIKVPFNVVRSELKKYGVLNKNKVTSSQLELLIKFNIGLSLNLYDKWKDQY